MTTTPKILLKKSSVAGRVPGASDLDYGELAINFEDGKIYYKDASNNIGAFIDSARVEAIANAVEVVAQAQLDSSEVTDLIDSDYIQLRIPETYLEGILDSAYVAARQVYYTTFNSDFDTRLATKSTSDVSEGTNLYYTKARADSDIASSLNDSGNSVSITINNTITDTVDSDYVLARVAEAPFLDSADTIQLIDSAYIQARESTPYIPTFGTDFVDSATVSTIITTDVDKAFIDSLDVDASTLNNQAASYYLDYANLNNTPTVLDATNVNSLIDTRVDKSFVDALNVDADTLDGQNGTHYLDYTNFTNTPTIPQMDVDFVDSARVIRMISNEALDSDLTIALVDSAYIQLRDRFQDSSLVTTTVDNAYVQARQIQYNTSDFTDSAFVTGLPVSTFTNDAGYLTAGTVGGLDSGLVIQLVDSAYVAARTTAGTDSAAIIQLIDSAYVAARTSAGTDSATVISLINSTVHDSDVAINLNNLVELGLGKNVTQNSYTSVNATVTGSRYGDGSTSGTNTAHPYLQVSSLTNFLAGMDSGEAIWVSSDGVNFTNPSSVTWTGGYITNVNGHANLIQLSTNVNFWTYSGQTVYSGADVIRRSLRLQGDSSSSKIIASKNLSIEGDNGATITVAGYNIKDSGTVTSIIDSAYINARVDPFDSSHVINLVDSAYISLRDRFQDSSGIIAIVDSAYVQARQTTGGGGTVDSAYVLSVVDSSATPLLQNTLHYTADSGQVSFTGTDDDNQTLAYSVGQLSVYLNGIFLIDSVDYTATNGTSVILIDSAQAGDVLSVTSFSGNSFFGLDSGNVLQLIDSAYVQARTTAGTDSSAIIQLIDSAYVQLRQSGGLDSALVTQLIDSDYVRLQTRIGDSDIDFGSNKILYSNVYSAEGDLPSATNYHGMFAHVHGTGAGYFAHAGAWTRLANYSDINPYSDAHVTTLVDSAYIALRDRFQDSAGISAIVDSAYVQARQTTGGSGTVDSADIIAIVDSAYVQARQTSGGGAGGLDSALISQLIDSDYIGSKVDFTRGEFTTQRSQYTATASQTVFNHSSVDATHLDVYLNGVLQVVNDDYTADTSAVTFASGVDSGYSVSIIERRGRVATSRGLVENKFQFTTASPTTIITGTDDTGKTLDYSNGLADVYLNGILLRDSNDYASNSGTSVTLVSATTSGDLVTIVNRRGLVTSPTVGNYEFTADSGQTVFTGNDINGQTLAYTPDAVQVHLNGIVLRNSDYIATNGTTVTLSTAADSADEILVAAFSNPGHNMEMYKFVADSAQTLFQGQDVTGASFAYEPGNIQVFLNGLLLNDSDDYLASNGIGVNLLSGAALDDELKVVTFTSNSRYVPQLVANSWYNATSNPTLATSGDKIFVDTSGGAKTVTLPSTALLGNEIRIIDVTGNAATNNITVGRNGHKIQGAASDLVININRTALGLVYYDSAQGWLLTEN